MLGARNAPAEIQVITIKALTHAAFICVLAYFSTWLLFTFWFGITQHSPNLFKANVLIFVLEAAALYYFNEYCKKEPFSKLVLKHYSLTIGGILSGLHLGIVYTYLIYLGELTVEQQYVIRLIATGFAGIVGSLWGIANLTGVFYAVAIISPHIIASYYFDDEHANLLTILSCLLWFFLYISTRSIQSNSFLQFISKYRLTQVHADSMEHLSKKDIVTKVSNRLHWLIDFEAKWKHSHHRHQPLSLIGFQVDNLHQISVTHGHQTGDTIVASIASLLQEAVANPDCLGRYQGDQFMLALPNIAEKEASTLAVRLAGIIKDTLDTPKELCQPVQLSTQVACNTKKAFDRSQSMVDAVSDALVKSSAPQ